MAVADLSISGYQIQVRLDVDPELAEVRIVKPDGNTLRHNKFVTGLVRPTNEQLALRARLIAEEIGFGIQVATE